jgi:cysteine synthase A
MERVAEDVLSLVGKTPMVKLKRLSENIPPQVWVKLETFNPTGSVKDRIALKMIEEAEKSGRITKDSVIIEPTSGNTGISLAFVCAVKGYRMIAVMPEAMSKERKALMELLGAEVVLVPSKHGPKNGFTKEDIELTLKKTKELSEKIPNSFIPNQFENLDNPKAHAETTAYEILQQTKGRITAFVSACGTGGTFTGIGMVLKKKAPQIKMVAVEPESSAVLSGCKPGFHKIQGIGEGFIPKVLDTRYIDQIVRVSDEDAFKIARLLAKKEGILSGISGGANVFASLIIGKSMKKDDVIVTLIPDNALRYFSTELFQS